MNIDLEVVLHSVDQLVHAAAPSAVRIGLCAAGLRYAAGSYIVGRGTMQGYNWELLLNYLLDFRLMCSCCDVER